MDSRELLSIEEGTPLGLGGARATSQHPGYRLMFRASLLLSVCSLFSAPLGAADQADQAILLTTKSADSAAVAIDQTGRGHVILIDHDPRLLEHLTISPDGQVQREVIAPKSPSGSPSAVVDANGRLFVATGGKLFAQNAAAQWSGIEGAPPCERLVSAGTDVACAFVFKGVEGSPGHWELGILGGATGCCLPFAWYHHSHKLVIARQRSQGWEWTVFDAESARDVVDYSVAGSDDGTVHVLYGVAGHTLYGGEESAEQFYARVERVARGLTQNAVNETHNRGYQTMSGQSLGDTLPSDSLDQPDSGYVCMAVDRDSGSTTLVVGTTVYVAERGHEAVPSAELAGLRCGPYGRIAATDGGRLHALFGARHVLSAWRGGTWELCYRFHDARGWSEPVDLGAVQQWSYGTVLRHVVRSGWETQFQAANGRVLAVWDLGKGKFMARWIKDPSAEDAVWHATWDYPEGERAAAEKCRLMTPGKTTGAQAHHHHKGHARLEPVVVQLDPNDVVHAESSSSASLALSVTDRRPRVVLERSVRGIDLGPITLQPGEVDLVRTIVAALIQDIVRKEPGAFEDGLTCEIADFSITTPKAAFYWDVTTRIELVLRSGSEQRTVTGAAKQRTYVWPSAAVIRRSTAEALRQTAARAGEALTALAARKPQRAELAP